MFQVPVGFSIKVSIDSNFKLKNSDKSLISDAIKIIVRNKHGNHIFNCLIVI